MKRYTGELEKVKTYPIFSFFKLNCLQNYHLFFNNYILIENFQRDIQHKKIQVAFVYWNYQRPKMRKISLSKIFFVIQNHFLRNYGNCYFHRDLHDKIFIYRRPIFSTRIHGTLNETKFPIIIDFLSFFEINFLQRCRIVCSVSVSIKNFQLEQAKRFCNPLPCPLS